MKRQLLTNFLQLCFGRDWYIMSYVLKRIVFRFCILSGKSETPLALNAPAAQLDVTVMVFILIFADMEGEISFF